MSNESRKRKNKNKKKKKKSRGDSSNGQAHEQQHDDFSATHGISMAAELSDRLEEEAEWETVVDPKRERARERQKQKQRSGAAKAQAEADPVERHHADVYGNSRKRTQSSSLDGVKDTLKSANRPRRRNKSKGKSASKKNGPKKPSNAGEMAALVRQILAGGPSRYMQLAALGNRIQTMLNTSWNKEFKSRYGSFKTFLTKKGDFVVDEQDRVFLKADHHAMEDQQRLAAEQQVKKQQRKRAKKQAQKQKETRKAAQAAGLKKPSTCGTTLRASAVAILIGAAVVFMGFVIKGDIDIESLVRL